MLVGAIVFLGGLVMTLGGRLFPIGRLPGDIVYRRGNFTFYFPLVTCIVLSLLLTLLFSLFRR
jgi:hypothetical protein